VSTAALAGVLAAELAGGLLGLHCSVVTLQLRNGGDRRIVFQLHDSARRLTDGAAHWV
jgi:hypothetical protein